MKWRVHKADAQVILCGSCLRTPTLVTLPPNGVTTVTIHILPHMLLDNEHLYFARSSAEKTNTKNTNKILNNNYYHLKELLKKTRNREKIK